MLTEQMRSISVSSMSNRPTRVALVVPHIFMHQEILPAVIFSPGVLALSLADNISRLGAEVTLFSPGPVRTTVRNINADLSLFDKELAGRGDSYTDLLRKHPFTFVTLARQVQSELIAKAYEMANDGQFDIVHIYTNEEELGMAFASLCRVSTVFTHHDPFNFLVRYKSIMPKYRHLNWLSISDAQRGSMPKDTNWLATIYHGIDESALKPIDEPTGDYFAYLGRIVEPKGVHLAINAVQRYNQLSSSPVKLKIAGKHYGSTSNDHYWVDKIEPQLGEMVEYIGFIDNPSDKQDFLGNARALLVPSLFDEPFGVVSIESLACGTPVIALDSGALPEIIKSGETGFVVKKGGEALDEELIISNIVKCLTKIETIDRDDCRKDYLTRFTAEIMAAQHLAAYNRLLEDS